MESDEIYVGVMHVSKNVHYPMHAHDAVEMFYSIAGQSEWASGREPSSAGPAAPAPADPAEVGGWSVVAPGRAVLHGSCQPHAMRTGDTEPVLLAYIWTGEITGKYWFCPCHPSPQQHQQDHQSGGGTYADINAATAAADAGKEKQCLPFAARNLKSVVSSPPMMAFGSAVRLLVSPNRIFFSLSFGCGGIACCRTRSILRSDGGRLHLCCSSMGVHNARGCCCGDCYQSTSNSNVGKNHGSGLWRWAGGRSVGEARFYRTGRRGCVASHA